MKNNKSDYSEKPGRSLMSAAVHWLVLIGVIILLIFAGMFLFQQRIRMPDSSMYPTVEPGDVLMTDRILFGMLRPARKDIVIFSSRYQSGLVYVRRIIGLPGETVQIINGRVYINGRELDEPEDYRDTPLGGVASRVITLGEDEYFVLCDNRSNPADSREASIGVIRREELEGRVLFRIWPADRIGLL